MSGEYVLNKILSAPVGKVVDVLCEILNEDVELHVIEQNAISPNKFERKVVISSNKLPVIKALAKFDSAILPKFIFDELLKKKNGIGAILTQNNINATRKEISMNHDLEENTVSREYEIINDGSAWFTIFEKIHLGNLGTSKNN